jgi:peptidoglycan DL-endopeptidase LytE
MTKKCLILFIAAASFFGFSSGASAQHYVKDPNKIRPNDYIVIRSGVETQKDLVDYAKSLESVTAYEYGGQNFPYETDCSGFVQGIYKKFGVNLPRVSRDQAKTGSPVKFPDLQIGDLMFFSTAADKHITHVGIYMGDDYFISNLNEKSDVKILPSWGSWSRTYFMWGTRYKL